MFSQRGAAPWGPGLFLFLVTVSPAWLGAQVPEHQGLG